MLVQTHADGFGVNLHQFSQRILRPAGDGHRPAQADIQRGHLRPRQRTGAVHARPGLVHNQVMQARPVARQLRHQLLALARCRAVANRDQRHLIAFHQLPQGFQGFFGALLRFMRVNRVRRQQFAGLVHHGHLTAGAKAGVNPQNDLPQHGRLAQQRPQIGGEHLNRVLIGGFAQGTAHIPLNGGQQQAFTRIANGLLQLGSKGRTALHSEIILNGRQPIALRHLHAHLQHLFALTAVNRQHLMRPQALHPRFIGVIKLKNLLGVFGAFHLFAQQRAPLHGLGAHLRAHLRVIADRFRGDIPRPSQRAFHIRHLLVQVCRRRFRGGWAAQRLGQNQISQTLQALFFSNRGPRPPFGAVRQVQVFQAGQGLRPQNRLAQLRGQLALLRDGSQDGIPPLVQGAQPAQMFLHLPQLLFIQRAGHLFAVARDKGDGVALVQQTNSRGHAAGLHIQQI